MTTATIYWAIDSDLGIYRVSNNYDIPLAVVDPDPSSGPVIYSLVSGSLPSSLQFSTSTGYVWGYAEYQANYLTNYNFTIAATKNYNTGSTYTITGTFTVALRSLTDENIQWVSNSDLGTLAVGYPSELSVVAEETVSNSPIKYSFESDPNNLPDGLTFNNDGTISGQIDYSYTGTYTTFTIRAATDFDVVGKLQTFSLNVSNNDTTRYTKIHVRPFLAKEKRTDFQIFINNTDIFDPNSVYRYFDRNFGVQSEIKTILDFGIEQIPLDQYTQALRENFYKRRFTLGKVKTAIAQDDNGNTLYEIIYVDVVDNLKSVPKTLYSNNNDIYYPASIKNMRNQLANIQLDDFSIIKVNRFLEPQFMRTPQTANTLPTGYIHILPLCYVKPGKTKPILKKIAASGFKFNMIDFEIDRLIVENSLDNTDAKYLLFGRESISDTLATDPLLYQGDVLWQFDDGVQLTRT
jgi:hypothetical protein